MDLKVSDLFNRNFLIGSVTYSYNYYYKFFKYTYF